MDTAKLLEALEQGDATAFVPVADALAEEGHPHAEELCGLASEIVATDDWAIALMAGAVFIQLLDSGRKL